jgi:hypothetical protein
MDAKTEAKTESNNVEISEYQQKLYDVLEHYPKTLQFQGLEYDSLYKLYLPFEARMGINRIRGLALNDTGIIAAVLMSLHDKGVRDAIMAYYAKNVNMRHCLYEWGKLQEEREDVGCDF